MAIYLFCNLDIERLASLQCQDRKHPLNKPFQNAVACFTALLSGYVLIYLLLENRSAFIFIAVLQTKTLGVYPVLWE